MFVRFQSVGSSQTPEDLNRSTSPPLSLHVKAYLLLFQLSPWHKPGAREDKTGRAAMLCFGYESLALQWGGKRQWPIVDMPNNIPNKYSSVFNYEAPVHSED